MTDDPVNHPKHYTVHPSGVECITVVEHMTFNIGNAVKYLWRADHKNGIEDLRKAVWYINREIGRLQGGQDVPEVPAPPLPETVQAPHKKNHGSVYQPGGRGRFYGVLTYYEGTATRKVRVAGSNTEDTRAKLNAEVLRLGLTWTGRRLERPLTPSHIESAAVVELGKTPTDQAHEILIHAAYDAMVGPQDNVSEADLAVAASMLNKPVVTEIETDLAVQADQVYSKLWAIPIETSPKHLGQSRMAFVNWYVSYVTRFNQAPMIKDWLTDHPQYRRATSAA